MWMSPWIWVWQRLTMWSLVSEVFWIDWKWCVYILYIYTLQIQNRSFSRVCSNTRGLHTKPEVFQNLIIFEVWLLFWIPCWIKSACWCVFFPWQNSPFLHVRHSWPWAGWHNHACYPIHFPKGYVFSADAPSQITFKPLKIQWNLNHLNPYKKYGLVRV